MAIPPELIITCVAFAVNRISDFASHGKAHSQRLSVPYDIIETISKGVVSMNLNSRPERQKRVRFAVGMAAIDGGKPTAYTQNLLKQYENGELSESQFKKAIVDKYTKVSR